MARPKKQTENLTAAQQAAKDEFRASMMQNLHLPNIPGFVFRWLNPDHRARIGMKVWAPVEATSELGKKMIEALATGQPSSIQQRGNFFYAGNDILGFTSEAMATELRAYNRSKADMQLEQVVKEHGSKRRIRRMAISRLEGED